MQQLQPFGGSITLIHYFVEVPTPPANEEGPPTLQHRIACMPNMTEFHQTPYHPAYQRTTDARAVSCPQCKKTAFYLDAIKKVNRG